MFKVFALGQSLIEDSKIQSLKLKKFKNLKLEGMQMANDFHTRAQNGNFESFFIFKICCLLFICLEHIPKTKFLYKKQPTGVSDRGFPRLIL